MVMLSVGGVTLEAELIWVLKGENLRLVKLGNRDPSA